MRNLTKVLTAIAAALSMLTIPHTASAQALCHAQNTLGTWFWGSDPGTAVSECQVNTPYGSVCYFKGCW